MKKIISTTLAFAMAILAVGCAAQTEAPAEEITETTVITTEETEVETEITEIVTEETTPAETAPQIVMVDEVIDGQKCKTQYDENGNVVRREYYNDAGILDNAIECYDDGTFKFIYYYEDGSISSEETAAYDERAGDYKKNLIRNYNEQGVLIEEVIKNEETLSRTYSQDDGLTYYKIVYFYGINGNVERSEETDPDGTYTISYYTGDKMYLLSKDAYDANGNYLCGLEYKNDENGKPIRINLYNTQKAYVGYYLYEYDAEGNQISQKLYDSDDVLVEE